MTCIETTCSKCGESKAPDEFYKDKCKKNGLSSYCKPCNSAYLKKYFLENPEKRFHKKHPSRDAARTAAWRAKNPEAWKTLTKKKAAEQAKNLTDYYVIRNMGLTPLTAPPEIVALKREQMRISRLLRDLKKQLKETK